MYIHLEINDLRAILDALDTNLAQIYQDKESIKDSDIQSGRYLRLTDEIQRKNRIAMEIAALIGMEWESYVK